jgi:hypothetical protein
MPNVIVASPRCASLRPMMPNALKDGPVRRPDISSLLSLAKYERAHEDDDYARRMIANGLVLILSAALIATGVLIVSNLHN